MSFRIEPTGDTPQDRATELLLSEMLELAMADAPPEWRTKVALALNTEHRSEQVQTWLEELLDGLAAVASTNAYALADLIIREECDAAYLASRTSDEGAE